MKTITRSRKAVIIAASITTLLAVVACGSDSNTAPASQPVQVAPTSAPVPTAVPPATPVPAPEPTATPAPVVVPTEVPVVEEPTSAPSRAAVADVPMLTSEEQLVARFMAHIEAGRLGDWSAFLSGCSYGSRTGVSPSDAAAKWRAALLAYELTNEGLNIVNVKPQILDGISALVYGDLANFQEISTFNSQGQSQAWLWTNEGGEWFDAGCSLGGA